MGDDIIATWAHGVFGGNIPNFLGIALSAEPGDEAWSLFTGMLMVAGIVFALVALVRYQGEQRAFQQGAAPHGAMKGVAKASKAVKAAGAPGGAGAAGGAGGTDADGDRDYLGTQRMFLGQLAALALVGFVIFLITENPTRPLVLLDQYSLMMLLLLAAELFVLCLSFKRRRERTK
jgi:Na+/melibiose symporter-like transporter